MTAMDAGRKEMYSPASVPHRGEAQSLHQSLKRRAKVEDVRLSRKHASREILLWRLKRLATL